MAHTPTPWKAQKNDNPRAGFSPWIITGADSTAVAVIDYGNFPIPEANTAFIVTACNSHEDLLDACQQALEELIYLKGQLSERDDIDFEPDENVMFLLDSLITRAKEGRQE